MTTPRLVHVTCTFWGQLNKLFHAICIKTATALNFYHKMQLHKIRKYYNNWIKQLLNRVLARIVRHWQSFLLLSVSRNLNLNAVGSELGFTWPVFVARAVRFPDSAYIMYNFKYPHRSIKIKLYYIVLCFFTLQMWTKKNNGIYCSYSHNISSRWQSIKSYRSSWSMKLKLNMIQ